MVLTRGCRFKRPQTVTFFAKVLVFCFSLCSLLLPMLSTLYNPGKFDRVFFLFKILGFKCLSCDFQKCPWWVKTQNIELKNKTKVEISNKRQRPVINILLWEDHFLFIDTFRCTMFFWFPFDCVRLIVWFCPHVLYWVAICTSSFWETIYIQTI